MDMATKRIALSRRALLRGLTGAAVGLPLLEIMSDKRAAAGAPPKRLVVFFTPNGTVPDAWVTGGETGFTLGPILQPLVPHQNDLIVLTGMNNQAALNGPGDDHQRGMGTMLTGTEMQDGEYKGGCDTCPPAGFAGGPSVDQVVAQKIGQATKLASMEFGVHVHDSDDWSRMSYSGAGTPMPPVDDPSQSYDRLFKDLNADPAGQKKLSDQRHLVLSSIMADAQKLRGRLGSADRVKLDQHLSSLDTINKHLDSVVTVGGSCKDPGKPAGFPDIYDPAAFEAIGKLQMDMLVMALTCDVTRVASIQWTRSVGDVVFDWLGVTEGHHSLSHHGLDEAAARDDLIKINTWYAQQFAYLVDRMKQTPEGSGTLLDNTVIFWCNELAIGNQHSHDDMRFLLAGSCGGAFKTGRHLSYDADPHNNLLLSLCQGMGLDLQTFGNPAYCTGPLAKL
jgi:hypothetical protein